MLTAPAPRVQQFEEDEVGLPSAENLRQLVHADRERREHRAMHAEAR